MKKIPYGKQFIDTKDILAVKSSLSEELITTGKYVEKFEKELCQDFSFFPDNKGTSISTSFSHIFQGGYSSGYYSYKWSEVLEADAFELFKEKGVFNKEVAQLFGAAFAIIFFVLAFIFFITFLRFLRLPSPIYSSCITI